MQTNKFNSFILTILGNNLNGNEILKKKLLNFIINILISIHLLFGEIISTFNYVKCHSDNLAQVLLAFNQIPAYNSCLLAYILFSFHKYNVYNVFNEIEQLIMTRMSMFNVHNYKNAINESEKCVKYPLMGIVGMFTMNTILMLSMDLYADLNNHEINTDKWFLPFLYKLVDAKIDIFMSLMLLNKIFFVCLRFSWSEDTFPKYFLSFLVNMSGGYIYLLIAYSQIGFISGFYSYVTCLSDDIRYQLRKNENNSIFELKLALNDVFKIYLMIKR